MTLREFRNALWDIASKADGGGFTAIATVRVLGRMGGPDKVEWQGYVAGWPDLTNEDPEALIREMRRQVLGLDEVGAP